MKKLHISLRKTAAVALLLVAVLLTLINAYGLSQSLRPKGIEIEHLRFGHQDVSLSQSEFLSQIKKGSDETNQEYAERLTTTIAQGLAHIHWEKYPPEQFNQTVPLWENYILYVMGKLAVTPEYVRYHFSNPIKSIERGIGLCGDASMLMSQLLTENGIENKIITIPGHVMVEAKLKDNNIVYDPDYGVILKHSSLVYKNTPSMVGSSYSKAGHHINDDKFIENAFAQGKVGYWDGIQHFITKKYYFEKIAYVAKWFIPIILLLLSYFLWHKSKR